jgi:hypothetical protein
VGGGRLHQRLEIAILRSPLPYQKDINMNTYIRISGEKVGMPADQWCKIIADDGENPIVARSCGDPTKIWQIELDWITAIKLSRATTIRVDIINVTRNKR